MTHLFQQHIKHMSCLSMYLAMCLALLFTSNMAQAEFDSQYNFNDSACHLDKGVKLPKSLRFASHPCDEFFYHYEPDDLLPVINIKSAKNKQGKYGFVNRRGKLVIDTVYDDAMGFHQGLAAVKRDNKWGYIDRRNHIIIPIQYDHADNFNYDRASVNKQGKIAYIDLTGHPMTDFIYDCTVRFNKNGLATVGIRHGSDNGSEKQNNCFDNIKWGSIDKQGNMVIPMIYDFSYDCVSEACEGFINGHVIMGKANGKASDGNTKFLYGLVNEKGEEVIPFIYDQMYHQADNSIYVRKDGKEGVIDHKHRILVDFSDTKIFLD